MTIGSALLQPQRFRRVPLQSPDDTLLADLAHLATRLLLDPEQARPALEALEQAFEAMVQRFITRDGTDLVSALERLRGWLQPLLDGLDTLQADLPELEDTAEALKFLTSLTNSLAQVADRLTIGQLRTAIAELLDILEAEFGLTIGFMEEQVQTVIGEVIQGLHHLPPTTPASTRATCLTLASFLGRVQRIAHQSARLPPLNADQIADVVLDLLRRHGLNQFAAKGPEIATAVSDLMAAGTALTEAAGVAAFGQNTLGAAEAPDFGDEYCWYASWLLKDKSRPWWFGSFDWLPGFPGDEVWRTASGRQIVQRNVWRDPTVLDEEEGARWHQAPRFSDTNLPQHYTFTKTLTPEFMEQWARHTSTWLTDAVKLVLHTYSAHEKRTQVSNLSHASWTLANGVFEQITRRPFVSWLNLGFGGPQATRGPLGWFVPVSMTLLASLGEYTKADDGNLSSWGSLVFDNGQQAMKYNNRANMARDTLLGVLTLLNYKKSNLPTGEVRRPLNGQHVDALIAPVIECTNALVDRLNNAEVLGEGRQGGEWLAYMLGLYFTFTSLGILSTILVGFALMRSVDASLCVKPLISFNLKSIANFLKATLLATEAGSDDGH